MDPAYAVAVDRAAQLRGEAAQVEKSIRHYEAVLRRDQEQGDRRWREMGFLRQVMHKSGARPDPWMRHHERGERHAIEELDKLDPRRVALAPQLPAAEKEMAAAFTRAEPAAAAELANPRGARRPCPRDPRGTTAAGAGPRAAAGTEP